MTLVRPLVRPRAVLGIEAGQRLAGLWDFGLDGLFDRAETGACGFRRIEIDNRGSSFIDTDLRIGKRGCKFVKSAPPDLGRLRSARGWSPRRRNSRSPAPWSEDRSEEHTSELQSLMRISYAVFCLKKKTKDTTQNLRHKRR